MERKTGRRLWAQRVAPDGDEEEIPLLGYEFDHGFYFPGWTDKGQERQE